MCTLAITAIGSLIALNTAIGADLKIHYDKTSLVSTNQTALWHVTNERDRVQQLKLAAPRPDFAKRSDPNLKLP